MDDVSEKFRQFMDDRRLKAPDVASVFHVAEQTIHHWRSGGIPPRRQAQILEWIAEKERTEFGDPADILRKRTLIVEATREELLAWQRAALASGKILDDWVRDGLNDMATAKGYGDLMNPEIYPLCAEEGVEYRVGDKDA